MQIAFTSTVEAGDVLVLPFPKDAVDTGRIEGEGAAALAKAAVDAARFKGEAGSIVELFAAVGARRAASCYWVSVKARRPIGARRAGR
ncbi:hypothetical protein GCM10020258_42890 [Sphingomonas yabuuchiae]